MFWVLPLEPVPVIIRLIRIEAESHPKSEVTAPEARAKGNQSQASNTPDDFIEVFARLIHLPSHPLLAVYRFLLESNMRLIGTAFAVDEGYIFLRSQRRIDGLDESEVEEMVRSILSVADSAVPIMLEQFPLGVVPA